MTILETDRLYLKVLGSESSKEVVNYYKRNQDFLKRWESIKRDDFYTLEYHKRLLSIEKDEIEDGKRLKLWIYLKNTNSIIGYINFGNIIRGSFESSFLGYKLDYKNRNKGYMTEALNHALNYYFNTLKLHRVEVNVMPENLASIKVVQKLGFQKEGLARKYLKINGVWEDHIHYSLIKDEFSLKTT